MDVVILGIDKIIMALTTRNIYILSEFLHMFQVCSVTLMGSTSTIGSRLMNMFENLLQVVVGGRVVVLLWVLTAVVKVPLQLLHFCLHIESFTGVGLRVGGR